MRYRFYTKPSKKRRGRKIYLDCSSQYVNLTQDKGMATLFTNSSLDQVFMISERIGVKFEVEILEETPEKKGKTGWYSRIMKWLGQK